MDSSEYEKFVTRTRAYHSRFKEACDKQGLSDGYRNSVVDAMDIMYPAMKLASEAGEVAGKAAKLYRDGAYPAVGFSGRPILQELSDCIWYITDLALILGCSLEELMDINAEKIRGRIERGTISGDGDDR